MNLLEKITDIELIDELVKRLKLSYTDNDLLDSEEFSIVSGKEKLCYRLGGGAGYINFVVEFYFDSQGNLLGHGVSE